MVIGIRLVFLWASVSCMIKNVAGFVTLVYDRIHGEYGRFSL
jgi:hypothetical protein